MTLPGLRRAAASLAVLAVLVLFGLAGHRSVSAVPWDELGEVVPEDRSAATGASALDEPAARPLAVSRAAFDERAFAAALHRTRMEPLVPLSGVRVLVIPHHWPAGQLITSALRDLAATAPEGMTNGAGADAAPRWRRVILLGPDHPKAGRAVAVTTGRSWSTPFGTVQADAEAVSTILAGAPGLVSDQPALLAREHGVGGLVPALAHDLPGARLVPLAVRGDARRVEVGRLAGLLAPLLDERTVVVVSVDFAHGLVPRETEAMDRESIDVLRALDTARLRVFGDEHLDARGALAVAMTLAKRQGATRFALRDRTHGGRLPGYSGGTVTSYVSGYYGQP